MSEFAFNPEVSLEREEVAHLAALISQPGFKVIQKICRTGVDQFTVSMINTDQSNEKAVLARHNEARAAAKYYTWVIETINNFVAEYVHSAPNDKPIDAAENLDIGDFTDGDFEEDGELSF